MDTDSLNSFPHVSGNSEIPVIARHNVPKVHCRTPTSFSLKVTILFIFPLFLPFFSDYRTPGVFLLIWTIWCWITKFTFSFCSSSCTHLSSFQPIQLLLSGGGRARSHKHTQEPSKTFTFSHWTQVACCLAPEIASLWLFMEAESVTLCLLIFV